MAPLNRRMFLKALAGIPLAAVAAGPLVATPKALRIDGQPPPPLAPGDIFTVEGFFTPGTKTLQRWRVSEVVTDTAGWCYPGVVRL